MGIQHACDRRETQSFRGKVRREHHEDTGAGGRIILKLDRKEIRCYVMEWVNQLQDRDQWRVPVIMVMNLRVL
jgi:hypothetical protein